MEATVCIAYQTRPSTQCSETLLVTPSLRFAGQRVRMAEVAVELEDRKPTRVVWSAFSILTFDDGGLLIPAAFELHQQARAELALAPALGPPARHANVVRSTSRFIDQGGRWTPIPLEQKLIAEGPHWGAPNAHAHTDSLTIFRPTHFQSRSVRTLPEPLRHLFDSARATQGMGREVDDLLKPRSAYWRVAMQA
jgi:hypothetical protein